MRIHSVTTASAPFGVPGGGMMRGGTESHRRHRGRDVLREDLAETRLRCLNGLILVPILAVIRHFPLLPWKKLFDGTRAFGIRR